MVLGWHATAFGAASPGAPEAFAAGSRAFQAGDWEQALRQFRSARDAGMQGPAVWYNIGVAQYRLGRLAEAVETFRSIADRFPDMAPLAQYNAGLALAKQARFEEAEAALLQASRDGDAKVARLAGAMLDRLPRQAAGSPGGSREGGWTGFTDFSAGFDDNVALLDDTVLPAGDSADSPFLQFYGHAGTPATSGGWRATGSAYAVRYPDAGQFDQNVLRLGAGRLWLWRDWRVEAGPHVSYSTLDGDGFERRLGGTLAVSRAFGPDVRFTAQVALEDVSEVESRFGFVAGTRRMLELRLQRSVRDGRILLEYEWTGDDRAAASVSPVRHELVAGYRHWIGDAWSAEAAVAFRSSRYDDLALPRDEDRRELSLALSRDLPGDWQLTGQYRLSDNDSNVDGFGYSRSRLAIGVNRVFR